MLVAGVAGRSETGKRGRKLPHTVCPKRNLCSKGFVLGVSPKSKLIGIHFLDKFCNLCNIFPREAMMLPDCLNCKIY